MKRVYSTAVRCAALAVVFSGCSSDTTSGGSTPDPAAGGALTSGGRDGTGGITSSSGGVSSGGIAGGAGAGGAPASGGRIPTRGAPPAGGTVPIDGGSADSAAPSSSGGAPSTAPDAGTAGHRMTAGVNVHDYPKPAAYGFLASDGKDRMGSALAALGVTAVRGPMLGDTAFLKRLHDAGVKEAILGLSASAHGKPFDPSTVAPALEKSLAAAESLGMTVQVEGLNEWDLFHSRPYNAGVIPPGMSDADFVAFTQKALYAAAHTRGIRVIGPSIGHPTEAASQAYFPDVGADVDIVNAHMYFTSKPESLDLPALVGIHTKYQGTGKPVWVTETGISSFGSVSAASQADVIQRGLALYSASGLIDRLYDYELLDGRLPGWDGTAFNVDNGEYHFGLYAYDGTPKPAATPFHDYLSGP